MSFRVNGLYKPTKVKVVKNKPGHLRGPEGPRLNGLLPSTTSISHIHTSGRKSSSNRWCSRSSVAHPGFQQHHPTLGHNWRHHFYSVGFNVTWVNSTANQVKKTKMGQVQGQNLRKGKTLHSHLNYKNKSSFTLTHTKKVQAGGEHAARLSLRAEAAWFTGSDRNLKEH